MTRAISGHCSQIAINHVTFEIKAWITESGASSTRLRYFLVCQKHYWHNSFFCVQLILGGMTWWDNVWGQIGLELEKITHRKSPHSWHTPWLSIACSSSPSPEREKTEEQGRAREGREEWESKYTLKTTFYKQYSDNQKLGKKRE